MGKTIATLNVIAWAWFWCFGYLALTDTQGNTTLAAMLAATGGAAGMAAWLWLVRREAENGGAAAPNAGRMELVRVKARGE